MEIRRVYGNEPTTLTLTDRAQEIYNNTDPMVITEIVGHLGGLRWHIRGAIDLDCYSEDEVSEAIVALDGRYHVIVSHWDGNTYCDTEGVDELDEFKCAEDYAKENYNWLSYEEDQGIMVSIYDCFNEVEVDSYFCEKGETK